MKSTFLLPIITLILSSDSFAQTTLKPSTKVLSRTLQQKIFLPTPGQCSLSRFSLITSKTEDRNFFDQEGIDRSTQMGAVIETSDLSCLRDYVVVQYIKGCTYATEADPETGALSERLNQNREFRGDPNYQFQHLNWVVDSVDADPMYASNDDDPSIEKRFDYFRSVHPPLLLQNTPAAIRHDLKMMGDKKYYDFFAETAPKTAQYFVTDTPTSGSYSIYRRKSQGKNYEMIQNASFEFKTCVYHLQDVPLTGDPTNEPIQCFEWNHHQIFNVQTKEFESPSKIAPFCLQ